MMMACDELEHDHMVALAMVRRCICVAKTLLPVLQSGTRNPRSTMIECCVAPLISHWISLAPFSLLTVDRMHLPRHAEACTCPEADGD